LRAVFYDRQGPAAEVLRIGDLPRAEPAAGEVRVRLLASGVNPADCKRRAGQGYGMEFPRIIPNSDGAGVVEALGPGAADAPPPPVGARVWLYNAQRGRPFGTAAESTCVPADCVSPLPDDVSFAEGACLGIPAMTAHRCLFADGPLAGLSVLVTGGGGAVGNYAVQLARWGGAATVIATARAGWQAEDARAAGAQLVIDRGEDVAARVMEATGGRGVDRVVEVDWGGNAAVWSAVLANNGVVAAYASAGDPAPAIPFPMLMRRNIAVRTVMLNNAPLAARRQAQADIVAWLRERPRLHRIAGTFPLAETAAAHRAVEAGGKRGTVVVLLEG
jgi:NADPH:quinone reductase